MKFRNYARNDGFQETNGAHDFAAVFITLLILRYFVLSFFPSTILPRGWFSFRSSFRVWIFLTLLQCCDIFIFAKCCQYQAVGVSTLALEGLLYQLIMCIATLSLQSAPATNFILCLTRYRNLRLGAQCLTGSCAHASECR